MIERDDDGNVWIEDKRQAICHELLLCGTYVTSKNPRMSKAILGSNVDFIHCL